MSADLRKADIECLDELIGMCEERMADPFRKKPKEEEVIEEKPSDDIGEDDSQELIDLYSRED